MPFIALTDKAWFDFLSSHASDGRIDEVNFWSPLSILPMKRMAPGEPIFFRLKHPHNAIVGYGFFAHFQVFDLDLAWELFSWKNGDPDEFHFLERIGSYRKLDLMEPGTPREPLGCTILRSAMFWPRNRWIDWGERMGWKPNIVRGRTEEDPERIELLSRTLVEVVPDELAALPFKPLETDERRIAMASQVQRQGQGTFRARLLDAYKGCCAITGEHTEPVLDAAHIQPYLGPRSNHIQNGLTLTKEFHALFDKGYVTITPEHVVRVSPQLKTDWQNGRRYYPYDGKRLIQLPDNKVDHPSPDALLWHNRRKFLEAGA